MKKLLTLILVLLAGWQVSATTDTLKVMTYNLRFGELATMEEIAACISSENPDIVALQECDWATWRERAPHQNGVRFVNELAVRTGLFGLYGKTIDYRGGYYGIGLLSKYPVIRSERILLPNPDRCEQRAMLAAAIEMPSGELLDFICTHLEVKTSRTRMEQARFINRWAKGKGPVLLAGDMNSTPDTPEIAELCRQWENLTNQELTYHTEDPTIKIDYIFGRPARQVELLSTRVAREMKCSDHFPVISEIVIHW